MTIFVSFVLHCFLIKMLCINIKGSIVQLRINAHRVISHSQPSVIAIDTRLSTFFGACSTSMYPTQKQHNKMWNDRKHRLKPWNRDVDKLLGMGVLHSKRQQEYRSIKNSRRIRGGRRNLPNNDDEFFLQARDNVVNDYRHRMKDVYADNLKEVVSRTRRSPQGQVEKVTVHLLENRPFLGQVETHLNSIFDVARPEIPYKIALAFSFLLYDEDKDEFRHFCVNDHLSRDATNRDVINHVPNIWTIRKANDEEQVMTSIRQSDFFSQVRDEFSGGNYIF